MTNNKDLAEILEQVQKQLASLSERIERLEKKGKTPPAQTAPAVPVKKAAPPPKPKPEISEEELLVVSAALAAYLGVRVHIRQIRLIGSSAWAQQGRVSIQASHILHN
jgi:methylmalonyl-CoA carboxyltransferase 12S subunit